MNYKFRSIQIPNELNDEIDKYVSRRRKAQIKEQAKTKKKVREYSFNAAAREGLKMLLEAEKRERAKIKEKPTLLERTIKPQEVLNGYKNSN